MLLRQSHAEHSHPFGCFSLLLTTRWLGCQCYGGKQPGIEPRSPRMRSGSSTIELLPPLLNLFYSSPLRDERVLLMQPWPVQSVACYFLCVLIVRNNKFADMCFRQKIVLRYFVKNKRYW
ncbi:hypothetical protein Tcan_01767 [Toxocara canis]|uniref:Uncharacterized protein n=1 Tax=Toxocara canis TaxID=6265 RepID=A0A0B2UYP2_TOXCA|nr:hypothetical protein Tcan_01767 [Toxocara canis]